MRELAGTPGTWSGLSLRLGQFLFAAASVCVMASAIGFANYTAFWFDMEALGVNKSGLHRLNSYLIASMGLQALWSLGLACLDGYALKVKKDLNSSVLVSLFVVGDWVTSILSFAASCSAGGVVVLFDRDAFFCNRDPHLPCGTFELATAFAFLSWALSATSALVMFWLLAAS